jgi:hypothetical protein
MSIYVSNFFSLPVKRHSGEHLSYEAVVNQLVGDTVSYNCGFGILGSFAEGFSVHINVELAKYEAAVAWLKDLMYGSEFVKERYRSLPTHFRTTF